MGWFRNEQAQFVCRVAITYDTPRGPVVAELGGIGITITAVDDGLDQAIKAAVERCIISLAPAGATGAHYDRIVADWR